MTMTPIRHPTTTQNIHNKITGAPSVVVVAVVVVVVVGTRVTVPGVVKLFVGSVGVTGVTGGTAVVVVTVGADGQIVVVGGIVGGVETFGQTRTPQFGVKTGVLVLVALPAQR